MRKWLVSLLLLGLVMIPSRAGAQSEVKLESLRVELDAEFDRPSMLVITDLVVSQDTPVPAVVTMRFPKDANLTAVAVSQDGGLFNAEFEGPEEQGEWQVIRLKVDSYNDYRIEYYRPLTRDGNRRAFEYQWSGEYAVNAFSLSILIPADSTDINTTPIVPNLVSGNGAISGLLSQNGLSAGQSYNFKLEYVRESDEVMNPGDTTGVQPSEPIGTDTAGRVAVDRIPYVIGGVGVVLIVIAFFFYWRSTQSNVSTPRRRKRSKNNDEEEQAYCHECGARARAGDHFCRTCGSRLRVG